MKRFGWIMGVLAGLLGGSTPVGAQTTLNQGFELNNFSNWTPMITGFGSAQVVSEFIHTARDLDGNDVNTATYSAASGDRFALLKAGPEGVAQKLSRNFSLGEGQDLSGWAFFRARDYLPNSDSGYVRITQGNVILFQQSITTVGDFGYTSWTPWQFRAPNAGVYTLEAGVQNAGDDEFSSFLGLDMEEAGTGSGDPSAVPEPGALALFLPAFSVVVILRQRKG